MTACQRNRELREAVRSKTLAIIVVLYNKTINSIESLALFRDLASREEIHIIVVDNSDKPEISSFNKAYEVDPFISYVSSHGNAGLSRGYNTALRLDSSDWCMLADDDTLFSADYLQNVIAATHADCNVICGMVTAGGEPLSPVRHNPLLERRKEFITEPGAFTNIYAINSGLVIKRDLLNRAGGFDERLFLDLVDYNLMETLSEMGENHICVVPGPITQAFSGAKRQSIRKSWPRFRIYAHDVMTYCKIRGLSKAFGALVIVKRFLGIVRRAVPLPNRSNEG